MTICPYCECENIDGADLCDDCGQALTDLHLPEPASQIERSLLRDRLGELNVRLPITVAASTPVRKVLRTMVDERIGSVIVMDQGRIVGIFSERDALVRLNTQAAALGDRAISQFMTTDPQTLEANAKVAFAVHRMDQGSYRHVPIVDNAGRPEGIISVRDILRYLTDRMSASTDQ